MAKCSSGTKNCSNIPMYSRVGNRSPGRVGTWRFLSSVDQSFPLPLSVAVCRSASSKNVWKKGVNSHTYLTPQSTAGYRCEVKVEGSAALGNLGPRPIAAPHNVFPVR